MKKAIVFLICIIVAFGSYFISEIYFNKAKDNNQVNNIEIAIGNSTGNIANAGYVTKHKDNIYGDINPNGQGLYKSNLKLKNPVRLTDDQALYVNADDKFIYYVNYSDDKRLYKVGLDGNNRRKLTADSIDSLNLEDGWLYYIDLSKNGMICKLTIDGSTKNILSKNHGCTNLLVKDGWVYYTLNKEIFRMSEDGSSVMKITAIRNTSYVSNTVWRGNFDIYNGYIYYPGEDGSLYCITIDGRNATKLTDGKIESINIYNGYIYYFNSDSKAIYRIKLEGKVNVEYVVGGGYYYNIDIVNDYGVMYKDKSTIDGGVFMISMNLNTGKH